jgi:GNAT superfamily N-acetyltransferase
MIEIKPYSKEFEEQHIAFAKKFWTKRRRFTPEYIYWKFRGKQNEQLKSFILAIDNGVIVGQFGLIPCKVVLEREVYDAQWACDLMVDTNYRGKGVADKLYAFAHENCLITLGSDPSPAAAKSMLKKGYSSIYGSWKFIFPIKIGEVFKLKGYNNRFFNFLYNPFFWVLKLQSNYSFFEIDCDEYKELADKTEKKSVYCDHDRDFMNWRHSAFNGYYPGLECYKRNESTFFSGYYVNGIYYLTEFNSSSIFEFLSIINFICSKYKSEKIVRIKFFSNIKALSRKLFFLGFVKFRTRTKIVFFTNDEVIRKKMSDKEFYYALIDSDENI